MNGNECDGTGVFMWNRPYSTLFNEVKPIEHCI